MTTQPAQQPNEAQPSPWDSGALETKRRALAEILTDENGRLDKHAIGALHRITREAADNYRNNETAAGADVVAASLVGSVEYSLLMLYGYLAS